MAMILKLLEIQILSASKTVTGCGRFYVYTEYGLGITRIIDCIRTIKKLIMHY